MHSDAMKSPCLAIADFSAGRTAVSGFFQLVLLVLMFMPCVPGNVSAADTVLVDSVAAFVDDQALTVSELQQQYERTRSVAPDISINEVLETMINRILLLREAKKYRIEAPTQEEILSEYIDLKVRAFIRISDEQIEDFYWANESRFSGRQIEEVRDEIEQYLSEREVNVRLKEMIDQLRRDSYIRINRVR